MKKQKNVLLALGWYDHRLLTGITEYAARHHWHLSASSITHELAIPWGWDGDGVLTWLAGSDELCGFVESLGKPTVDFSLRRPDRPFMHVIPDHAECARLAADHFLHRGFKNHLFYSDSPNWTSKERGDGFAAALATNGHDCAWLKWHEQDSYRKGRGEWIQRRAWLAAEIERAEKPLAVFTANGTLAVEIQEVCELAGIAVPQEVAIVGIEDDLLLPQSNQRQITAIDPDFESLGYHGAAWLDRMMKGARMDPTPVRIPPRRIIARSSTDITAVNHPGIARALRYIATNFSEMIEVETLARVAGMSRRSLHKAFLEHVGFPPGEHLRSVRIGHAKRLLLETNHKVEAIATRCGYLSLNSFFCAFKASCGVPPGEFRKQSKAR